MNHPIDNLFYKKLKDMEVKPSAYAFERLQLMQKSKPVSYRKWYAVAASFLLIISAGYFFSLNNKKEVNDTAPAGNDNLVYQKLQPSIAVPPIIRKKAAEEVQVVKKTTPGNITMVQEKINTPDSSNEIMEKKDDVKLPDAIDKKKASLLAELNSYSGEGMAVIKASEAVVSTTGSSDQTLIQKIAGKARVLKEKDGVMAELREIKDEVLSFEFLKNNKKSI